MTRRGIVGPAVKVDSRWVVEWIELTGKVPCHKAIRKAVKEFKTKKKTDGN